jgi:DnaK suppressor protein
MTSKQTALDATFITQQKQRLEALRDQLVADAEGAATEEQGLQLESVDQVRDSADAAETMAIQENDEAVFNRNPPRLRAIQRALEKIEQGTYGLSDVSGEPIPRARLEAMPEAVSTVEEKQASEESRLGAEATYRRSR